MDHPGATKEAEQPKWQQVGQRSFAVQIHKFCVQVPRTLGKNNTRRKPNSSSHCCYTSLNENSSIEEPSSSIHFRTWSSASNLSIHLPMFLIENHLMCAILWVCPSFIHRLACWTTSYSLIQPDSLATFSRSCNALQKCPHLGMPDASFKWFPFLST